ncbi:MAG TPA: hypothetical protein VHD56_06445 [Tepidisphaeraceae bacterium]|nr:hypothetical protein [Tepidisphaeraceae bacterium]
MRSIKMHWLAGCTMVLVLARSAGAVSQFSFVCGQVDYQIAPGETADVPLFLRDDSGSVINVENGLFAAGLKVSRNSAGAALPSIISISSASGFDGTVQTSVSSALASLYEDHASAFGPGAMTDGNHLILLGIVRIYSGSFIGQTSFQIADDSSMTTNTITYAGTALDDSAGINSESFTITVTPEPCCLCFAGVLILAPRRR